ncbi:unnamed protein product, partial [Brassica oleracea]
WRSIPSQLEELLNQMEIDSVETKNPAFDRRGRLQMQRGKVPHLSASTVSGVTVSQFTTLFQITAYSGRITYINSGDFAVSAVVHVVGIILCLHAATKISHRAQAIASVASKWHAIMSCSSTDTTQIRTSPSGVHLEATTNPPISFQN